MTDRVHVNQAPEEIVLQKEEVAYGFIIEVLTRGLYPNKFHVVREYIQNAYDAILAWRRSSGVADYGRIDVKVEHPSIFIFDNGTGMDREKVSQYRYVGYSEKRTGEGVGFRGIGKLSGISVAEKLIVTTSPAGVAERYKLIFDSDAMLNRILVLKADGKNIPLTDLIRSHTTVVTENEDPDQHYTLVELHKIRADSATLMDKPSLRDYVATTAPVDFDPGFTYGKTIDAWLREYVSDYDTAKLYFDGNMVYKPYVDELNPPQKILALENLERPILDDDAELVAFCWYCEHANKGQFPDRQKRGLMYRVKNFAVGTNQLPRTTLWRNTPERAFYFFGEIHVCDQDVVPSSTRDEFEHNAARERLFKLGAQSISQSLSWTAGKSSAIRRAKEFVISAEEVVDKVKTEFDERRIPRDLKIGSILKVSNAIADVAKRLKDAPEEFQVRGQRVIEQGQDLVKKIDAASPEDSSSNVYDIKQTMQLNRQAARVYEIIIDALKDEFVDQPDIFEHLIKRIHKALEDRLAENE